MYTFTVVVVCVMLSVVSAQPTGYYPAPAPAPVKYEPYEDRDYRFAYAVRDDATYNEQTREESKYGNVVKGAYTVLEPTGDLRVVNYIADENGFRAQVQNQPTGAGGYAAPAPHKTPYYAKAPLAY